MLSVALERVTTKPELMARYRNQVYFGNGAYGIAAAAETYFATSPDQLRPEHAALLAVLIRALSRLDPWRDPGPVRARRDALLEAAADEGVLDPATARGAAAADLGVVTAPNHPRINDVDLVRAVEAEIAARPELGASPGTRRRVAAVGEASGRGGSVGRTAGRGGGTAVAGASAGSGARRAQGQPTVGTAPLVTVDPLSGALLDSLCRFGVAAPVRAASVGSLRSITGSVDRSRSLRQREVVGSPMLRGATDRAMSRDTLPRANHGVDVERCRSVWTSRVRLAFCTEACTVGA